jgi:hypothetical protein
MLSSSPAVKTAGRYGAVLQEDEDEQEGRLI